jgi:hypothetical protein
MALTATELEWIDKRMDWYDIKYQEIYDEISDHIITAIEDARQDGDHHAIDIVFQRVADSHFGGYLGIDEIVKTTEKAYRGKIEKTIRANYGYYTNRQKAILLFVLIAIGFCLPYTKTTAIVMTIGLLLIAIVPVIYAYAQSRAIKTNKGKKSMVKSHIIGRAFLLVIFFNGIVNTANFIARGLNWTFMRPIFPPVVYMVFYFLFIIYGLSIVRLCKQEFKIAD